MQNRTQSTPEGRRRSGRALLLFLTVQMLIGTLGAQQAFPGGADNQWSHLVDAMSQHMFKYDALAALTGRRDSQEDSGDHGADDRLDRRSRPQGHLWGRLTDVADAFYRSEKHRDNYRGKNARMSGDVDAEESHRRYEEHVERQRLEQLAADLEEHRKYNEYLVGKHGHEEAAQLAEKGLVDFSNFMDTESAAKLEHMHLERLGAASAHPEFHPELLSLDQEIDEAVHYSWEGARDLEREEEELANKKMKE